MKRIILIILLLSCNRIIRNLEFKSKDINEELATAIINNDVDKALKLIDKGANINYVYNNKSILELALNNKNLEVLKGLLKKDVEVNRDNIAKLYDLALDDFSYDIVDIIKDKYKLEEGLIDNNKYFLLLCYTSNAEEVKRFIEKYNVNPKEVKDKINRSALIISAFGNKVDIFKMLVEEYNLDINHKNNNGVTPLMAVCDIKGKELIEYMIKKGANIHAKDSNGWTVLMRAGYKGYIQTSKILIDLGANVDDKNNSGWTALMIASDKGHTETAKLLLEKGANVNDKNNNDWTALMLSSDKGHTETVKLLIEAGTNINDKNNNDWTALMLASDKGHTETAKLLLEKGANVNDKNNDGFTSLLLASQKGHTETSKLLTENDANVNDKDNNGLTALMFASRNGYVEVAKILLEKGCNINLKNNDGLAALMFASANGRLEVAKVLLEKGCNINLKNNDGLAALMFASANGCLEVAKVLLEKEANIDEKNKNGWTALMFASAYGHLEVAKVLLEKDFNINLKNNDGLTALIFASANDHVNVVKALLEKGANINAKTSNGLTALMLASANDHVKVVKILLEKGAIIDEKDKNGWTPLMFASKNGHSEVTKTLLEKGANTREKNENGQTPLMLACSNGREEIAKILLEKDFNINFKNDDGFTALMFASASGHAKMVEILMKKSANVDEKDKNGWTALMFASSNGHAEGAKRLIKKSVNIDEKNNDGFTSLMIASDYGHPKLVKILIKKGANIDEKDKNGWTALMFASKNGHSEIAKTLLEKGANVDEKNKNGWTSLMFASSNGHAEAAKILLEKGTDVNDKDDKGWTPLMLASYNGHTEVAKILLEKGSFPDIKNNDWTALMFASEKGHIEIVRLLIKNRASINERVGESWINGGKSALTFAYEKNHKEIVEFLISKGAYIRGIKNIILEDILINNIKTKEVSNCLLIINNNKINFNYKDNEGNNFLHYAAIINNKNLFNIFLNKGDLDINTINKEGRTPLYYALSSVDIDENFLWYLIKKNAVLGSQNDSWEFISKLLPYEGLCNKIIFEGFIKKLLGDIELKYYDKLSLSKIIKLFRLDDKFFNNNPKIIEYIKNVYNLKYKKIAICMNQIENLVINEDLEDVELDIDFLVGVVFDLEAKNQYYGDNNLTNLKESFSERLKNIAETKTPNSIPSLNSSEIDKTNYIKYLTKKKLRDLGKFLTNLNSNEREEKIVYILNHLLVNLSCHVGILEAVTNAYNSLLYLDIDKDLEDIISRELMLYRVKLIEEIARKHFNSSNDCKLISKIDNTTIENRVQYNEHMKAYLVMSLKEELKVIGLYEKDFEYKYNKIFIVDEVKKLYKERALDYIMQVILENRSLQNKMLDYIQSNIFKNILLNDINIPTVLHIKNFVNDDEDNITRDAIISILIHLNFIKIDYKNQN